MKYFKQYFVASICTIIFDSCNSQKIDQLNREIKSDTDLLYSTTWLVSRSLTSTITSQGTGYFYFDKGNIFIITNAHVVSSFSHISFDIEWSGGDFTIDSLQYRIAKFNTDKKNGQTTDLVAIKISNIPYLNLDTFPKIKCFNYKNIPSKNDIDNLKLFGETIIALSYPEKIMSKPLLSPIIYNCTFASNYFANYSGEKEFIVNGNMSHGCSGSPIVCIKGKGKYLLLGTFYFTFGEYKNIDPVISKKGGNDLFEFDYKIPSAVKDSLMKNYGVGIERNLGMAIKSEKLSELLKD
jgi:hypothetical protein